jgi:asparagine synthase (glutamine-hydrolysing)
MSLAFRLERLLRGISYGSELWNPVWLGPLDPDEIRECFLQPADVEDVYAEAIALWDSHGDENVIDRTTQFYVKLYFQDGILVKLDRAGMLNSLEVRCPFLDIDVVNFTRKLPHAMRIRDGQTKYLLKRALRSLLPRDVIERKKHGFPFPAAKWFRERRISVDSIKAADGQRSDFVQHKVRQHLEGRRNERLFLWNQWLLNQVLSNRS